MKISKTKIHGLFELTKNNKSRLATLNKVPGTSVYGEELVSLRGQEYRLWDPFRSKYAAAFLSGIKKLPQIHDKKILYLGVSTGTTASHFSDILDYGAIFGVEFSPKVMRKFYRLAEKRSNLIPILADARRPEEYSSFVTEVDLIYQDVAQPDQARIFGRNVKEFLKEKGEGILAIKSQSIDVAQQPDDVFSKQIEELEHEFNLEIVDYRSIEKFEKKHAVIVVRA